MALYLSGPWRVVSDDHGVTVEEADLTDGRGGTWIAGASRVSAPGEKTRVFKGETAWSDADRHALDLRLKRIYA